MSIARAVMGCLFCLATMSSTFCHAVDNRDDRVFARDLIIMVDPFGETFSQHEFQRIQVADLERRPDGLEDSIRRFFQQRAKLTLSQLVLEATSHELKHPLAVINGHEKFDFRVRHQKPPGLTFRTAVVFGCGATNRSIGGSRQQFGFSRPLMCRDSTEATEEPIPQWPQRGLESIFAECSPKDAAGIFSAVSRPDFPLINEVKVRAQIFLTIRLADRCGEVRQSRNQLGVGQTLAPDATGEVGVDRFREKGQ